MTEINWIFCADNLPTEIGEYIVAMQHKTDKKPFVSAHWFNADRGGWMSRHGDCETLAKWLEIMAWAALPELPDFQTYQSAPVEAQSRRVADLATENAELREELVVTEEILAGRQQVLEAIPQCAEHGLCVPHALEWIADRNKNQSLDAGLELQLCPFCGQEAILESNRDFGVNWYWVRCVECSAQSSQDLSISSAVQMWIRRS